MSIGTYLESLNQARRAAASVQPYLGPCVELGEKLPLVKSREKVADHGSPRILAFAPIALPRPEDLSRQTREHGQSPN